VGTSFSPIRLYQPKKGEKSQYATLSYCWGEKQRTTTTENLSAYTLALPQDLPKTILDAIEVCRSIGISYLWVDALCIVQNDGNEKMDQISKMGSIYKNSTVTIVAASANTVSSGFLYCGPNQPTAELPVYIDDSTTGSVFLRGWEHVVSFDEPVFTRAWAFQELLLSPRALVFDSRQITLKCLKYNTFKPVLNTSIGFRFDWAHLPVSVFGLVDNKLAEQEGQESRNRYIESSQNETWRKIVDDYSHRHLTFFEDRLPALAGIATELAKSWNDVYLAGLWQKTIIRHLGWRQTWAHTVHNEWKELHGIARIGRPSWSWVTVPYPVYITSLCEHDAKFVHCRVKPVSHASPFGAVRAAHLVLKVRVLKARDFAPGVEYKPASPYGPFHEHRNRIQLDFEDPKPEVDNCLLVYLGETTELALPRAGIFLAVEKLKKGGFQRVGHIRLLCEEERWKTVLAATKRRTIVIS
jgi:hypothetical protein